MTGPLLMFEMVPTLTLLLDINRLLNRLEAVISDNSIIFQPHSSISFPIMTSSFVRTTHHAEILNNLQFCLAPFTEIVVHLQSVIVRHTEVFVKFAVDPILIEQLNLGIRNCLAINHDASFISDEALIGTIDTVLSNPNANLNEILSLPITSTTLVGTVRAHIKSENSLRIRSIHFLQYNLEQRTGSFLNYEIDQEMLNMNGPTPNAFARDLSRNAVQIELNDNARMGSGVRGRAVHQTGQQHQHMHHPNYTPPPPYNQTFHNSSHPFRSSSTNAIVHQPPLAHTQQTRRRSRSRSRSRDRSHSPAWRWRMHRESSSSSRSRRFSPIRRPTIRQPGYNFTRSRSGSPDRDSEDRRNPPMRRWISPRDRCERGRGYRFSCPHSRSRSSSPVRNGYSHFREGRRTASQSYNNTGAIPRAHNRHPNMSFDQENTMLLGRNPNLPIRPAPRMWTPSQPPTSGVGGAKYQDTGTREDTVQSLVSALNQIKVRSTLPNSETASDRANGARMETNQPEVITLNSRPPSPPRETGRGPTASSPAANHSLPEPPPFDITGDSIEIRNVPMPDWPAIQPDTTAPMSSSEHEVIRGSADNPQHQQLVDTALRLALEDTQRDDQEEESSLETDGE